MKTIIVTGGLGFIGSNLIELLLSKKFKVINIDKVSYASITPYDSERDMWLPVLKSHKEKLEEFLQPPASMGSSYTIQTPNSIFMLHNDLMASLFFKDRFTQYTRFIPTAYSLSTIEDKVAFWRDLCTHMYDKAEDRNDITIGIYDRWDEIGEKWGFKPWPDKLAKEFFQTKFEKVWIDRKSVV